MTNVGRLKILIVLFLLPKVARSYKQLLIGDEHIHLIIDICKFYGSKSIIFSYSKFKDMEMTTTMFKWTRVLSREGLTSTTFYFSDLHKSMYYANRVVQPHYIVIISNHNDINEFSLVTKNFDMTFSIWVVLFIYEGHDPDYCHNPPGNIFHLRFDSKMIVRCSTETILREWYTINTNRTEIQDIASWSLEKGISRMVLDIQHHNERKKNLKGLIMKTVLVKTSPFVYINEAGELDGLLGRMFGEFSITLNCTFEIVSEIDTYGRWNSEKNIWTGAIGELYFGRADISLSGFSMTSARLNAVDFTFPIFVSPICFYIREPEIFTIKWSSYFQTYSRSLWIAISGLLIVASILLIFLKIKDENNRNIGQLLSDNFLEVWGIFCQQGVSDIPDRFSLRIAYFSMFFMSVVLSAAYSASLTSFLTTGIYKLPFHSLESFVEDGTYQLSVLRDSAAYDTFANSNDPLEKKIMKLMIDEDKLPVSIPEGFMNICKNHKLALYTTSLLKDIIHKMPCKIVSINTGRIDAVSIILSKHNQFTNVFNFNLKKFLNNGMNNRIRDKIYEEKSNNMIKHQPVYIITIISLFFYVLIGIILSICILIIEKCIFARKRLKMSMVHRLYPIN